MPRHSNRRPSPHRSATSTAPAKAARSSQTPPPHGRPFRVLVVDPTPTYINLIEQCTDHPRQIKVIQAQSLATANQHLGRQPIDLAIIESELPDGSGFELARAFRRRHRRTQMLFVTDNPSMEAAIQAIRLGATDFLVKPLDGDQLGQRVREVIARHNHDRHQIHRIRRLRRACQKLNLAREEISQQVDILCNDLVTAYHELASQMQQTVNATEYQAMIRQELDLEQLLRKTLEYLVERAGPTNAAMFLPATSDEFSLGGYVNFDCSSEAADLLLQHLGDVFAPQVARHDNVLRLNSEAALSECIGDDAAYLAECDVIAFACQHEGEPLAVITLFRDQSEPFDNEMVDICNTVAPIMAEALSRLIRIHHRQIFIDDEDTLA